MVRYIKDQFSAFVENDLEIDVTILLKFVLPIGDYTVDNGNIIMVRQDDTLKQIYVSAYIEQMSKKSIIINQKSE